MRIDCKNTTMRNIVGVWRPQPAGRFRARPNDRRAGVGDRCERMGMETSVDQRSRIPPAPSHYTRAKGSISSTRTVSAQSIRRGMTAVRRHLPAVAPKAGGEVLFRQNGSEDEIRARALLRKVAVRHHHRAPLPSPLAQQRAEAKAAEHRGEPNRSLEKKPRQGNSPTRGCRASASWGQASRMTAPLPLHRPLPLVLASANDKCQST